MRSPGAGAQVTLSEDEAAYALASLLAGADGVVTHAETRRVESGWLRFAASHGLTPTQARDVAQRCRTMRATMGRQALLAACERTLASSSRGREAVLMAARVADADGKLSGAERADLERVMALVGLRADALARRAQGAQEGRSG